MKYYVLYNPLAGKGSAEADVNALSEKLYKQSGAQGAQGAQGGQQQSSNQQDNSDVQDAEFEEVK